MTAVHVVVGGFRLESCPRRLKTNTSCKSPQVGRLVDSSGGCRWCRAKTFFSQNELLLEPRELGYTLYTLVRL